MNPILWRRQQAYEEKQKQMNSHQAVESIAHVDGYEWQSRQLLALLANVPAEAHSVPLSLPFPYLLSLFMTA